MQVSTFHGVKIYNLSSGKLAAAATAIRAHSYRLARGVGCLLCCGFRLCCVDIGSDRARGREKKSLRRGPALRTIQALYGTVSC